MVGQTRFDAVRGRIRSHLNCHSNGNLLIKRAVEEYGKNAFEYEILHDGIIPEFLNTLEIEAIAKYNTVAPNGYNLESGGNSNKVVSDEARQNMSKAGKGRKKSAEHVHKVAMSNTGKKRSKESVERIRQSQLGKVPSKETREKQRIALLGKPQPPRNPYKLDVKKCFLSLPSGMPRTEKNKIIYKKFSNVLRRTIRKWTQQWESES